MFNHNIPDMFVFSQDKRECYGATKMITEMTKDIRFNACSEIQLKVIKECFDPIYEKLVQNPSYDYFQKYNLLYLVDDNTYFSYPNRTLKTNYGIKSKSEISTGFGRSESTGSTTYENPKGNVLNGFSVQPETRLYNISVANGYNWWNLSEIDEFNFVRRPSNWSGNYFKCGCPNYVPIDPYDVIAVKTKANSSSSSSAVRYYKYDIFFYTSNDANSVIAWLSVFSGHKTDGTGTESHPVIAKPVYRFSINSMNSTDGLTFMENSMTLSKFKDAMKNGGYIRVCVQDSRPPVSGYSLANKRSWASFYHSENGTTTIGWSFPYDGWLTVFSGRRFCSQVDNDNTDGTYELPLHWFVITDVEEEYDGLQHVKTVTAFSYEYTISNRCISLSEDTLPLYTPQGIIDAVNSDNWIIDKLWNDNGTNAKTAKQYMGEGLLNQVLKVLPDWSIGHISSALMSRYRTIDEVDNRNLYSFLMNDIQSVYQCYFVFDTDNKTISAYTQDDIVGNSQIILNRNNAIKKIEISDIDTNVITALRVHTADDYYSTGLISPTGNNIIYNFDSVLDKMDFVADTRDNDPKSRNKITENGVTRNRTLKEAVIKLMNFINHPDTETHTYGYDTALAKICTHIGNGDDDPNTYVTQQFPINGISDFREIAKKFAESNMLKISSASAVEQYRAEYQSVLDKIQVQAEYKMSVNGTNISYYNREYIHKPSDLDSYYSAGSNYSTFISDALYAELVNACKNYWQAYAEYQARENDYNAYYHVLQNTAMYTNLDYYRQKYLLENCNQYGVYSGSLGYSVYLSILTPLEILALQSFIREGDWTNDNSIFSENYDVNDIFTTLIDVYTQAKNDMDTIISKPDYDLEITTLNISEIPELKRVYKNLKVGQTLHINTENSNYVKPILLEVHINYTNKDDFKMTFTSNYKRKPIQFRFADLYSSISQTSVTDNTFTFDE